MTRGFQLFSGRRVVATDPKIRVWLRVTSPVAREGSVEAAADGAVDAAPDAAPEGAVEASVPPHAATIRPTIARPTTAFASRDDLGSRSRDLLGWVSNAVTSWYALDRLADPLHPPAGAPSATVARANRAVNMEYDIRDGSAS